MVIKKYYLSTERSFNIIQFYPKPAWKAFFCIVRYKNHESVHNTRHLNASSFTLVYLSYVIASGRLSPQTIYMLLIKILCQIHDSPKFNIYFIERPGVRLGFLYCLRTRDTITLYHLHCRDATALHCCHFTELVIQLTCTLSIDNHWRYGS